MELLAFASSVAIFLLLAHNLGLVGKVGEVVAQVLACPRCTVFWGVLLAGMLEGYPPLSCAVSAIGFAYLVEWLALPLGRLARLYDKLWKRTIRRDPPGRR